MQQGTRVQVRIPRPEKDVPRLRERIVASVRSLKDNDSIRVKLRPLKTCRAPPLDDFGQRMFGADIRKLAESKEEALDKMLLVLYDALLLGQSEEWTDRGVANLPADECYELARWWSLGQNVGRTNALFDGICAMCGALLYGAQNRTSAISNKCSSPPCDRDGKPARNTDGTPKTDAQPPVLLRYSPQLFAKEAPEMFVWHQDTNRLSLKPGMAEPWVRPSHAKIPAGDENTWLYCGDCRERWFRKAGERGHAHIPFP